MIFLSVRHKPMREQAFRHEVIDVDTGEKIPRVIWANDETGRYRQYLTNENGELIIENNELKTKTFKRNIKLVPKEINQSISVEAGQL